MSNSETKILKLLLNHKEERYSIKKISELLQINYRIAYEKVLQLEKENLLKITSLGNCKICELTNKFNQKLFEAEYERKEELLKNSNFKVICRDISKINSQFILLLFGSYAKGTQIKHSDIDLLLISDKYEEIDRKLKLLPLEIHLTPISYADFINMLKSKEFTVVSEALKKNIILFGVEDYYRMIENAG